MATWWGVEGEWKGSGRGVEGKRYLVVDLGRSNFNWIKTLHRCGGMDSKTLQTFVVEIEKRRLHSVAFVGIDPKGQFSVVDFTVFWSYDPSTRVPLQSDPSVPSQTLPSTASD